METTIQGSPILVLPKDNEVVGKLRRKLAEYRDRVAKYERDHPHQHPGFRACVQASHICRIFILERLFADKTISAWPLSEEFFEVRQQEIPEFTTDEHWIEAWSIGWGVIEDYCTTGGQNVYGGTGLR